jgi:hypothetical protein
LLSGNEAAVRRMNMMVALDTHLSGHGLEGACLHGGRSIIPSWFSMMQVV